MLQQTRMQTVLPYFEKFVQTYPTLKSVAQAEENEILSLWSGLGYYNRARNLHRAAQMICKSWGGEFPRHYDQAIQLPGIGRYSAGAILSIAYREPLPVLDGNVARVFARYLKIEGDLYGSKEKYLWKFLARLVRSSSVRADVSDFNQALMELGAQVCTPRRPACPRCPLAQSCRARRAGVQEKLPSRRPAQPVQRASYLVAVLASRGKYLLMQNLQGSFLKGLWEFPRVEGKPDDDIRSVFARVHGLRLTIRTIHPPLTHQITFRKLIFHPVRASLVGRLPEGNYVWVGSGDGKFPVSSYVRKIMRSLME